MDNGSNGNGRLPYVFFYPKDFRTDKLVEDMSLEEVGAYIILLCRAWEEKPAGSIPADKAVLCKWLKISPRTWDKIKDKVLRPFEFKEDGRLHQKRMREEFEKATNRVSKAKNAIGKRWGKAPPSNTQTIRGSNTIASGSTPTSVLSFPETADPNGPPPRARSSVIDIANPPFRASGMLAKENVQDAIKGLLRYFKSKFGRELDVLEFNCLMSQMEAFRNGTEVVNAIQLCISKNWKNPVFPGERSMR